MKPLKLCLALVVAAMLAASSTPSVAQDFFENLRKTFNNSGNSAPEKKQTSASPPKFLKNLKRSFADLSAGTMAPSNLPKKYARTVVSYKTSQAPGTIIIDPREHYLYLVLGDGKAMRYGVGVGRDGFGWHGTVRVGRKAEWPGWTPPPEMIARERRKGIILPAYMEGGVRNPLGARALYLYNGGGDTAYRIHGSNEPWTIGRDVSSGCFRMVNKDVIDLYNRVRVGAKVIVL
jgi:lipoprotein-anchoring transpeptidase ErfK/SrfK